MKLADDLWPSCAAGLSQLLHGEWLGHQWSRAGLAKRMRWLVLDEGDLLMSGGYAAPIEQLLEVLPPPLHVPPAGGFYGYHTTLQSLCPCKPRCIRFGWWGTQVPPHIQSICAVLRSPQIL